MKREKLQAELELQQTILDTVKALGRSDNPVVRMVASEREIQEQSCYQRLQRRVSFSLKRARTAKEKAKA